MGIPDALNYMIFTNPISSNAGHLVVAAANVTGKVGNKLIETVGFPVKKQEMAAVPLWKLAAAAGPYVKLAAVSGASAVALGAYGSHKKYNTEGLSESRQIFDTASKYHFFHTLALLGLPLCRAPGLAATFLISGMIMFCGSCYYCAFTGDKSYNFVTPFGGVCFIVAWLSMLL